MAAELCLSHDLAAARSSREATQRASAASGTTKPPSQIITNGTFNRVHCKRLCLDGPLTRIALFLFFNLRTRAIFRLLYGHLHEPPAHTEIKHRTEPDKEANAGQTYRYQISHPVTERPRRPSGNLHHSGGDERGLTDRGSPRVEQHVHDRCR